MKKDTNVDKLINFKEERNKRIHDLHEKRLQEVQQAFNKAFPLPTTKKAKKNKEKEIISLVNHDKKTHHQDGFFS